MIEPLGTAPDGRRQRGERSRQAIIDAALALVEEGVLVPTAQQVSDRAGVAMRTFFRHFNDMDSLFAAIDETARGRMEFFFIADVPQGSLQERIEQVVEDRARAYEGVSNVTLSTRALLWRSSFLTKRYAADQRRLRRDLDRRLPEAALLDKAARESLDAITSFDMWHRLRGHQGLSRKAGIELIAGMVKNLLD
ncbi:MAG: TetR/AcrR family transcriptional regulator [Pseudomonadota bacterium]